MDALVSIIMPAYNAERYIAEAIRSVLAQTHTNWELLLVNDGSLDGTAEVVAGFKDPRIRVFTKSNGGIGSARNLALSHVTGQFMCGLDADDVFPPKSLESRLEVFEEFPDSAIVDGQVLFMDQSLKDVQHTFEPSFIGEPYHELISLKGVSFMGFSWLLRWDMSMDHRFDERITHGEDLLFYLSYSPGRKYRYTNSTVLLYRRTGNSAMSNLDGLQRSYNYIHDRLLARGIASKKELRQFRRRTKRIMIASFLRAHRPFAAIKAAFN